MSATIIFHLFMPSVHLVTVHCGSKTRPIIFSNNVKLLVVNLQQSTADDTN